MASTSCIRDDDGNEIGELSSLQSEDNAPREQSLDLESPIENIDNVPRPSPLDFLAALTSEQQTASSATLIDFRSKVSGRHWADVKDSDTEEEEEDEQVSSAGESVSSKALSDLESNEEEHEENESKYVNIEDYVPQSVMSDAKILDCICVHCLSSIECLSLMEDCLSINVNFENHTCIISNIIRCYNKIFSENDNVIDVYKLAYTDLFFRVRHEILFKCFCMCFNFPVVKSDKSFRDFGIDSNRTPDLIIEENGILYIFEVTATSSLERAAVSKGMEQMGFESKYIKEIRQLNDKGLANTYLPLFFDMSNSSHPLNHDQFNEIKKYFNPNNTYKSLMRQISKEFSILSINTKNKMSVPASLLFTEVIPISRSHPSWEFLYVNDEKLLSNASKPSEKIYYKEFRVSTSVYNKIGNSISRLFNMIDNSKYTDIDKVFIILNTSNNSLKIEQNNEGKLLNEIRGSLISGDMMEIFKCIKLKTGELLLDTLNSETGVRFTEKTSSMNVIKEFEAVPSPCDHETSRYISHTFSLDKYEIKLNLYNEQEIFCNIIDYDYEDKIISLIKDMDNSFDYQEIEFGQKLLGQMESKTVKIDKIMEDMKLKYIRENLPNTGVPIKKLKGKTPFILPIVELNESSYCELKYKNEVWIKKLVNSLGDRNPYTELILRNVIPEKYKMHENPFPETKEYRDLVNIRSRLSNEMNLLHKKLIRSQPSDGVLKISKTKDPEFCLEYQRLSKELNNMNKTINSRKKMDNIGANISYVRLPTKGKKTHLRSIYEIEMSHFKNRKQQSTIEGVGMINSFEQDHEFNKGTYNDIVDLLCVNCGKNPDKVIDFSETKDVKLLKELKELAKKEYKGLIEDVVNSYLGHSAAFISRMAHSLLFYSQLPFSSDYIRVDNLGYKNVLLIVKGGKKIFKSKSSKLFRLIYPISNQLIPWYEVHNSSSSTMIVKIDNLKYCITPWMMLHENILTDSLSFYHRITSFTVLNINPELKFKSQFNKIALNILLAYHNRRQTEALLANLRYILLSTLGDFTGVVDILPEFFGFNYDCFQSFIRSSIIKNYPSYFKGFQVLKNLGTDTGKDITEAQFTTGRIKNIFSDFVITNTEDLALMIYSTFLMTKAPYQKLVERANNLRGMIDIHKQYDSQVGLDLNPKEQFEKLKVEANTDYRSYSESLFENDFKFDPKYCALVGNFLDSYLINMGITSDIHAEWIKIINQNWDEMATSTGLRGDYEKVDDFWGKKGYFVVYKGLLNNPEYKKELLDIFFGQYDDDKRRKKLRMINETYKDKMEGERDFLIFHAVDKSQWRGSREIFVMDLFTKTLQQPIEKFMGYLCKQVDNELISVPSDRRAQLIHHVIFEKDIPVKTMMNWYLTLDCSKWAPKSIFTKFAIMINNMTSLPNSFKIHFLNYIEKLYNKRIYFNVGEVEVLLKNPIYTDICNKYLIKDDKVNGYYIKMPYSWVMGIFNYTSSILHAANQKYFSYILMKTSIMSFQEESSLTMFAHSDDSGGRLCVSDKKMAVRALCLYEINLKCCNHLLSKKKSVVSRIYFEILSIIYMFNKLLALLPKFLGGLRFLPTDKGPAQDMLQSYSKCIEVQIAGANFSVAYLVMKFYSSMIWRFYYNREPLSSDYERPVQYLGIPDAHPIMVLLCGSDSDICRLISKKVDVSKLITFVNTIGSMSDGEGPIKPLKFIIKVRGIDQGFEKHIEDFELMLDKWSVRNVNYRTTGMNTLSFLRRLSDPGFVGSLVNESTVRRISRSYFIRSGQSTVTRFGNIKLLNVLDSLQLFQSYVNKDSCVEQMLLELLGEEGVRLINDEMESNQKHSDKQYELLLKTLSSPLKISNYMDQISLDKKAIVSSTRTLKPTLVQLVKSTKVFSVDFEPSSLVSYIKEPDMRWALSNVRNIYTASLELEDFCYNLGFDVNDIDPDMLLRMCRTYGRDSDKVIYLYSRVPSEIRKIKTYSAFLTFISVNSLAGKEIEGLVLKLNDKDVGKEYLETHIDEEIYLINNIINLIYVMSYKCDKDFLLNLDIKPIPGVNDETVKVDKLLNIILDKINSIPEFVFLKCQLYSVLKLLNIKYYSPEIFYSGAFYTFIRSQKMKSGWFGKGEVYINIDGTFYSFILENKKVKSVHTNKVGKINDVHINFILDVFNEIDINFKNMSHPKVSGLTDYFLGLDIGRGYSVLPAREITSGIPANIIGKRNEFIDHLIDFEIDHIRKDSIFIKMSTEFSDQRQKLHFLPIKKTEIGPITLRIFNKSQFESKLLESGLNDFEEFLNTEVLTEYGNEVYVDFDTVFDNFSSSKLYEVFQKVYKKSLSKIPDKINTSILPAPEGSLARILIDYTNATDDKVLKTPVNLNPDMMKLRSEFPEEMSVILSENLVKYHKIIYNNTEQKEIEDSYFNLSKCDSLESLRKTVIQLMTYWGYGSLVNSINTVKLIRSGENYLYFNLNLTSPESVSIYSKVYEDLVLYIRESMEEWQELSNDLDLPIKKLKHKGGLFNVYKNYILNLVYSIYNYRGFSTHDSLGDCVFINCLIGLLCEDEFCATLQSKMAQHYILNSLLCNYKNRFNFVILLNTLKMVWSMNNQQRMRGKIDYCLKLFRFPDDVINPISIVKRFISIPSAELYYGSFLNLALHSYLISNREVITDDITYRISSSIKKQSGVKVPMIELTKFKRPLSNNFLESDEFDELTCECSMADLDDETIEDLLSQYDNKYVKMKQKVYSYKNRKVCNAQISWIIDPYVSHSTKTIDFYRQQGENIIILTDCIMGNFLTSYPNSGVRLVNYGGLTGSNQQDMLAYYSFNKILNKPDFISKYIGGREFLLERSEFEIIKCGIIRNKSGVACEPWDLGIKMDDKELSEEHVEVNEDGVLIRMSKSEYEKREEEKRLKDEEDNKLKNEESMTRAKIMKDLLTDEEREIRLREDKFDFLVNSLKSKNELSEDLINKLSKEYMSKLYEKGVSLNLLLDSIMQKYNLMVISTSIDKSSIDLTSDQQKRIFSAPEHFSLAYSLSRAGNKPIKDKKIRSEINSIKPGLADYIGSCTLNLSNDFKSIVTANYLMWNNMCQNTSYKSDNKKFLLKVFLSLVNNATVSNDKADDGLWQDIINRITLYICSFGSTEPNIEEDLAELFGFSSESRLKYKSYEAG